MRHRSLVPLGEAIKVWLRIGFLSFGGPAGQIALMHRILVEEKRWIGEARFLHALNYCMLLPGPEAQQLATYIGWLMNRTLGGLIAGILFILPGLLIVLALSAIYAVFRDTPFLVGLFYGVKPAVVALVAVALWRLSRRALRSPAHMILAILAFVALFVFALPFPVVVLGAGMVGFLGAKFWPHQFASVHHPPIAPATKSFLLDDISPTVSWRWVAKVTFICLALWLLPTICVGVWLGWQSTLAQVGLFFSKMAVVTFGGAYAVLSYVGQQAVSHYNWLGTDEMVDGLALAETTPGPLILVLSFVAFLAGYRSGDAGVSLAAGLGTALFATWVTFVPCFLFIFAGAPFIEKLRDNRAAGSTLSAITAAVVGVILNLGLWFAFAVFFKTITAFPVLGLNLRWPLWQSLDWIAVGLFGLALLILLRLRWGTAVTLGVCGLLGILIKLGPQWLKLI